MNKETKLAVPTDKDWEGADRVARWRFQAEQGAFAYFALGMKNTGGYWGKGFSEDTAISQMRKSGFGRGGGFFVLKYNTALTPDVWQSGFLPTSIRWIGEAPEKIEYRRIVGEGIKRVCRYVYRDYQWKQVPSVHGWGQEPIEVDETKEA